MINAFNNVWAVAVENKVPMRLGAYVHALTIVAKAIRARGSY